jgi:HEAT repeat protein
VIKPASLLAVALLGSGIASADIILLKDGSRFDGTLTPAEDPAQMVLSTGDLARAKAIDPKATGWKVVLKETSAEITLPKALIHEVVDPSRDASPLIRALEHPDKRVRYAASRALVGVHPKAPFIGADKVVRNLADAVGEAGIRVVLVATDDTDLSNRMAARVRAAQHIPVQAFSAVECLGALKRSPTKDVILLDASLGRATLTAPNSMRAADEELIRQVDQITHYQAGDKDIPVEKRYARELFLRLQDDYRARRVPVIVLAEEGAELELVKKIYAGQRVAAVLPKTADEPRLKAALAALFQRDDPSLKDSKDLADEASLAACRTLATLSRDDPVFRVGDAEEALVRAFSETTQPRRVDGVRVAALEAAGAIGTSAGYTEILGVLKNPANAVELRRAAASAIADIARATGLRCPDVVVAGLQEVLKDPDPEVWVAAARALGVSQADLAKVRDVLVQERLEKSLKE